MLHISFLNIYTYISYAQNSNNLVGNFENNTLKLFEL